MINPSRTQGRVTSNQDTEHLRLLTIFHYVVAGIVAMSSLFPLFHITMGIAIVAGTFDELGQGASTPPAFFGWMIGGFSAFFIVCGIAMAIVVAMAGQRIQQHRSHTFCLVVAGIECLFTPLGTALGVFTFIVLSRPSVKELFNDSRLVEPESSGSNSENDDHNPWSDESA